MGTWWEGKPLLLILATDTCLAKPRKKAKLMRTDSDQLMEIMGARATCTLGQAKTATKAEAKTKKADKAVAVQTTIETESKVAT